jgi:anti-sigma regulatory factor (Ser/Thr protein kinase)
VETIVTVSEPSQIAQARRQALAVAGTCAFSEEAAGKVALIVTEAGTNLVKYARGGYLVVRPYAEGDTLGVEILALDNGPGLKQQSLQDGHSTGGSLGLGMGTILRMSTNCEIYTGEGRGTAILARVAPGKARVAARPSWHGLAASGLSTPKPGQEACGDAWAETWRDGVLWLTAIDGLGHGPQAAAAAAQAIRVFHAARGNAGPEDILSQAHGELKATRGAVMAVAAIRPAEGRIDFAGVGNIAAAVICREDVKRLSSMDGTVGYSIRQIRGQSQPWTSECTLIMNSDGLSSRWNLNEHPGLLSRHPSLVAAVLHRDFGRQNDDTTVVVAKHL